MEQIIDSPKEIYCSSMRNLKKICNTKKITIEEALLLMEILQNYFYNGRPQTFAHFEKSLTPKISEIFSILNFSSLYHIAHDYFMFCKSSNWENFAFKKQQEISKKILEPFYEIAVNHPEIANSPPLKYTKNERHYLIVTRHAVTKGTYAPGRQIFVLAKGLLKRGKKVKIVTEGNVDSRFAELGQENANLKIIRKKPAPNDPLDSVRYFHSLRALMSDFKPIGIFTEMELGVLTAIEGKGVSSPIFLLSAGFYEGPGFQKKFLTQALMHEELKFNKNFCEIPETHSLKVLAPIVDPEVIKAKKIELKLTGKFVIGSFARYEKFTKDFFNTVSKICTNLDDVIVVLAGPNDQSPAKIHLHEFILGGKVKLLGVTDVSILGHCCDVFLETHPMVTGYAALESMAKNKPVFTLECEHLQSYRNLRIDKLVFPDREKLVSALAKASKNVSYYQELAEATGKFITSVCDEEALAITIENNVH